MKALYLAVLASLLLTSVSYGQLRPGPDPRSKRPREFKPRVRLVVYIEVASITRGIPSDGQAETIRRAREKFANEPDQAKRDALVAQIDRIEASIAKSGDWLLVGLATSNKVRKLAEVSLRVPRRMAGKLADLSTGEFVRTLDPYPDGDSRFAYQCKLPVVRTAKPSWWDLVRARSTRTPTRPERSTPRVIRLNPVINKSWPRQYGFHPAAVQAKEEPEELADVLEQVMPAVFTIYTTYSQGTGFVINRDGTALTNQHVIEGERKFTAEFADGRRVEGSVIGVAENADLALLKLPDEGYSFLPLVDHDELRIGEAVFAVGAPFDLGHSVSQGIASSFRQIDDVQYIQTDASLNHGNSGGPLINEHGAVIGVATLKQREADGIGFAIRIAEAIIRLPMKPVATADSTKGP